MTKNEIESIKKGNHPQFVLTESGIKCKCGHNAVYMQGGYICGTITAYPCIYN